eukprot:TRINITY_DN2706_c2_g1_i1.p1 TRINITY_DN2706_c2_g1~~TRINITY_DN2706_c2_g1_i1.p1  ORF type:complete len:219 (+),score=27.75 TRINITY_DN2706_c2_g1_i1:77-733(+)
MSSSDGSSDLSSPQTSSWKTSRPQWVKDEDVSVCSRCMEFFSTLNRRHHCRQCGHIFCGNCTQYRVAVPRLSYDTPVRVCKTCHDITQIFQTSNDVAKVMESAKGLLELSADVQSRDKMIEQGCIDILARLMQVACSPSSPSSSSSSSPTPTPTTTTIVPSTISPRARATSTNATITNSTTISINPRELKLYLCRTIIYLASLGLYIFFFQTHIYSFS